MAQKPVRLPMLALRGLVVFPHMSLHFDVGRERSIAALEEAMQKDQKIFLVAQRDMKSEEPGKEDLYAVGTISRVKQMLKLPGETMRVLVEGIERATLEDIVEEDPFLVADVSVCEPLVQEEKVVKAYVRVAHEAFEEYSAAVGNIAQETQNSVAEVEEPDVLPDLIAANLLIKLEDKQRILEAVDTLERLKTLCDILTRECELKTIEMKIKQRVKHQVEKNQKEYFLREQIRAINRELGDRESSNVDDYTIRLAASAMTEEAHDKTEKEIRRLARLSPSSPEVAVSTNYIEWLLDLPWDRGTTEETSVQAARKVLEDDHYGLEKVKERIVEYLAVRTLKKNMQGPILCLVGPPGVGKTSIAQSIARATGRSFVQMSLGGVRDEAEIRGHRRTYIGAIPGRIISSIKQSGSNNPLFLLDEIDKLQGDFRGDPAAAMLEVLDSAQNHAFRDHYLDVAFDLSKVMFICTANSEHSIPAPLLDRMEVIRIAGYTEQEKVEIAKTYLVPRQITQHGLKAAQLKFSAPALHAIVNGYTREAGVRQLNRTIEKICRKAACRVLEESVKTQSVTPKTLEKYLGPKTYHFDKAVEEDLVGIATGLAWTPVGGDTLMIEVTPLPGSGELLLTGQLGDVMKESARAAWTVVRARAASFGLDPEFYKKTDLHIHVPQGAIPKDGPSAGITLCTAILSALSGKKIRQGVAMTGEITLRGRVLMVGGIKEKLLAAHRAGIQTVLLPKDNQTDLLEIPESVREQMRILPVEQVDEVFREAFTTR